jgi:very-short-patch-repair endonuclease
MSLSKNPKLILVAKDLCRDLRKHSTDAEQLFWERVRNRNFFNKKFYRQYPLFFDLYGKETFFIADFYCHVENLIVEIDGGYHKRQKDYDALRTDVINCLGIDVIRFTNEEVMNNVESVLNTLKKHIES